jgi:hypothetical protein
MPPPAPRRIILLAAASAAALLLWPAACVTADDGSTAFLPPPPGPASPFPFCPARPPGVSSGPFPWSPPSSSPPPPPSVAMFPQDPGFLPSGACPVGGAAVAWLLLLPLLAVLSAFLPLSQ